MRSVQINMGGGRQRCRRGVISVHSTATLPSISAAESQSWRSGWANAKSRLESGPMRASSEDLVVEFLDERQGLVSGPWHDEGHERVALDLLGGLRATIRHPACLRIFDVGRAGPRWWATFEAVRGFDLLDWRSLEKGDHTRVAATVISEVAAILAEVNKDWSHITRPEHVLITVKGEIRLAYFEAYQQGICAPIIDHARPSSNWHELLAPEIISGEEHHEGTMVYAL